MEYGSQTLGELVDRLARLPGIGKKTAQRIILELTGKLGVEKESPEALSRLGADLVSGMVNLGYPLKGARETVGRILKENPGRDDFEELFKIALKKAKP